MRHARRHRSLPLFPILAIGLVTVSLPGARVGSRAAIAPEDLPWDALAEGLVERMALEPGERVLLVCRAGRFEPLVPPLRYTVMRAGAVDLGCLQVLGRPYPGDWDDAITSRGVRQSTAALKEQLRGVDLAVMMPGALPSEPAYAALQELLEEGQGRTIHFHWAGAFDLSGDELPLDDRIDRTYIRAVLQTDYRALAAAQRAFESAARGSTIRVTTPAGTDLRFRIGDRPVNRQDGDASAARAERARVLIDREIEIPAGAIRVAPREETVNGVIVFPRSEWSSQSVEGLRLAFERGKVVSVEARNGGDAVLAELEDGGAAARSFREFALGFNPLLAMPEEDPWIPYYGYGAGVVRLSLGDNSELGGEVRGDYVRWNFFPDATVTLDDGEVWVRDGRLVR